MYLKDYYTILGLPPSATFDEIKKSYRRLAHLYHPDKKNNDPYAAARFAEIKEAYEVLTHPHKKDLYLQQRWYAQSTGKKKTELLLTPETMLKRMLELDRYIHTLDIHRMDKEGLYHYFIYLLSNEHIEKLNAFHEYEVNKAIMQLALKNGHLIPYDSLAGFIQQLQKIELPGESFTQQIKDLTRQHQQFHRWEKWKVWIILLLVLSLCFSIFMIARN